MRLVAGPHFHGTVPFAHCRSHGEGSVALSPRLPSIDDIPIAARGGGRAPAGTSRGVLWGRALAYMPPACSDRSLHLGTSAEAKEHLWGVTERGFPCSLHARSSRSARHKSPRRNNATCRRQIRFAKSGRHSKPPLAAGAQGWSVRDERIWFFKCYKSQQPRCDTWPRSEAFIKVMRRHTSSREGAKACLRRPPRLEQGPAAVMSVPLTRNRCLDQSQCLDRTHIRLLHL